MTHLADLSATEAARRLRDGRLTATALCEALLDRIAAREPVLRAFAWLDPALARRQAAQLDAARAAGRAAGPLHGLALGVKDVLDTADQPAQYGSPIWAGHRPRADAACVALGRRAGAVILGKTVTTEFATRHPGPTANPSNPVHTPGGSSSGSAAGAAAGYFHAGFGTQTAGSVIRPAAYCGAVGFKPSYGTLHRAGMKVMSESLDTIGVITRTVGDAALVMGGLAGRDYGAPEAKAPRAPRLALCWGPTAAEAKPETRALLERVAQAAARAGATVEPLEMPPAVVAGLAAHALVMNGESRRGAGLGAEHGGGAAVARAAGKAGLGPSPGCGGAGGGAGGLRRGTGSLRRCHRALRRHPDAERAGRGAGGPGLDRRSGLHSLWTLLHVPCVTVPVGAGPQGLPLGVQLVTGFGQDAAALAWAEWVRQAAG